MPKRDPRVGKYVEKCAPFARPVLKHLRKVIHSGGAGIEETIKWGMPTFLYQEKIVCGFAGFKAHCALWFWKGRAAVVGKRSKKEGMGNFGRIRSMEDLPSAATIKGYVKKGMKRIDREHQRRGPGSK
jgi:hypothetical protein